MKVANTLSRIALVGSLFCFARPMIAAEAIVFAAASLTESLRDISKDYEKQSHDKVIFNFGASSILARQIEEGAPADIFFSADEAQMDRLENKGLIAKETRQSLLSNSLVIIVAAQNGATVRSPKDLLRPEIRKIALGDPKAVPIGVYAREYLQKQGLWTEVFSKIIPTENVRGALAAVESGNAEASIVYKTDALISSKITVAYTVPVADGPAISYPVALLKGAPEQNAASRFLSYLGSDSARNFFEKRGFMVANGSRIK